MQEKKKAKKKKHAALQFPELIIALVQRNSQAKVDLISYIFIASHFFHEFSHLNWKGECGSAAKKKR